MGWRTEPSGTPAEEIPLRSPKGVRPIRRSFSIKILPTKKCELEFRNPGSRAGPEAKVPGRRPCRWRGIGGPRPMRLSGRPHSERRIYTPPPRVVVLSLENGWDPHRDLLVQKGFSQAQIYMQKDWVYGFIKSEISNRTVSTDSTNCYCYRCLQKDNSGEENMWEDKLWEHQIRGWRAISAAGLQGKGSHTWIVLRADTEITTVATTLLLKYLHRQQQILTIT